MMKFFAWLCLLPLLGGAEIMAASASAPALPRVGIPLPGRLFYTPTQRAMLVDARAHRTTEIKKSPAPPVSSPMSFDGVITRSDGVATHWIDGRAHAGQPSANIRSLKPGQTRAYEKVYEPYQVQRPGEALNLSKPKGAPSPSNNESTP